MRTLGLLLLLGAVSGAGEKIDEIKWMSSKDAFKKAKDPKTSRWVLIYKEWPR
jgi:hypothetical protein